jgi:hypothetical protein
MEFPAQVEFFSQVIAGHLSGPVGGDSKVRIQVARRGREKPAEAAAHARGLTISFKIPKYRTAEIDRVA